MKLTGSLILIILFSVAQFSCSKQPKTSIAYSSMEEVFSMLRLRPKMVVVDATTGGSFIGNSGTRYILSANTLQTESGMNVEGQVQVTVCEYLQKGDMLFSKLLPISNNEPLLSGGELNISASQNGQPLFLKPNCTYQEIFLRKIPQTSICRFFMASKTKIQQ